MPTPAAVKAARMILGNRRISKARITEAAETIDLYTHLHSTVRTCAIILRDIEKSPETLKNSDMKLAKFALRDVILASGYKLDQLSDIIKQKV